MSLVSDPSLRSASRSQSARFAEARDAASLVRDARRAAVVPPARARWSVIALLTCATTLLGLRLLATALAAPLDAPSTVDAPAWMVELTTTGTRSTTALVYGPDVGLQFLRVPAAQSAVTTPRLVPARLARGEVHFVSLGLASPHIRSRAPAGADPMAFEAVAPILTAFQSDRFTGVRTGW